MITKDNEKTVEDIKKFIYTHAMIGETGVDLEKIHWIDILDRLVNCLQKAPLSYRYASLDTANRFYTAECDKCGWWGSSKLLDGGGQIADTGDYGDVYCPVCGNTDVGERENINEKIVAAHEIIYNQEARDIERFVKNAPNQ